jgi:hypothetical protein
VLSNYYFFFLPAFFFFLAATDFHLRSVSGSKKQLLKIFEKNVCVWFVTNLYRIFFFLASFISKFSERQNNFLFRKKILHAIVVAPGQRHLTRSDGSAASPHQKRISQRRVVHSISQLISTKSFC